MKFKVGDKITWRYDSSYSGSSYCSGIIRNLLDGHDPLKRYHAKMDPDYYLNIMEEFLTLNHTGETFEDISEKEYHQLLTRMGIDIWK